MSEDRTLLIDIFSLPAPAKKKTRADFLRSMLRINRDNSRAPKWRAELAALNASEHPANDPTNLLPAVAAALSRLGR